MPAADFYSQHDRSSVKNPIPGYTHRAWVAPVRWLYKLRRPAGTYGADALTIALSHIFYNAGVNNEPGGGFIQLYASPNTVIGSSDTASDAGSLVDMYKLQLFLPGDSPELQQMLNTLMNDDLIIIIEDANKPGATYVQYGSIALEGRFTKKAFTSGTTNFGHKGWAIEAEAPNRFYYTGNIKQYRPYANRYWVTQAGHKRIRQNGNFLTFNN